MSFQNPPHMDQHDHLVAAKAALDRAEMNEDNGHLDRALLDVERATAHALTGILQLLIESSVTVGGDINIEHS